MIILHICSLKAVVFGFTTNPQNPPVAHWLVAVQDPPITQLVPLAHVDVVTVGKALV